MNKFLFSLIATIYLVGLSTAHATEPASIDERLVAVEKQLSKTRWVANQAYYQNKKLQTQSNNLNERSKQLSRDNQVAYDRLSERIIDQKQKVVDLDARTLTLEKQTIELHAINEQYKHFTQWTSGLLGGLLCIVVVFIGYVYRQTRQNVLQFNLLAKDCNAALTSFDSLRTQQRTLFEKALSIDMQLVSAISEKMPVVMQKSEDHTLVLKVADEITRIQINLSRMDSTVKGYKQLNKAVERILNTFQANGYEIISMLGAPYNEGMRVVANFVIDDSIEMGQQIITGIIKPQVNYRGQMIQAAEITVSQNI